MRKAPAFAAVALVVLLSGCADPANWPKQPLLAFVDGNIRSGDIGYDLNRDGRVDYIQHIEGGLKTRFRIDSNGDNVSGVCSRVSITAVIRSGFGSAGKSICFVSATLPQSDTP